MNELTEASLAANKATLEQAKEQKNLITKMSELTEASLAANKEVSELTKALAKDSSNMKIIAILTALFLPGTFMAVSPPLSS